MSNNAAFETAYPAVEDSLPASKAESEVIDLIRAQGVPRHLFEHYSAGAQISIEDPTGLSPIVFFGTIGMSGRIGVEVATGHVVDVYPPVAGPGIVNSSLERFAETVRAVIGRFPYYEGSGSDTDIDRAVVDLRDMIRAVDPAALETEGFWSELLDSVGMGDYASPSIREWLDGRVG